MRVNFGAALAAPRARAQRGKLCPHYFAVEVYFSSRYSFIRAELIGIAHDGLSLCVRERKIL